MKVGVSQPQTTSVGKRFSPPRQQQTSSAPRFAFLTNPMALPGASPSPLRDIDRRGVGSSSSLVAAVEVAEYRLLQPLPGKQARWEAMRAALLGNEEQRRRELLCEAARSWTELCAGFYTTVTNQHSRLKLPAAIPVTNAIDGVPLLAAVYVAAAPESHRRQVKANITHRRSSPRLHDNTEPPQRDSPKQSKSQQMLTTGSVTITAPLSKGAGASAQQAQVALEAALKFDQAVKFQKESLASTYAETSNAWLPHNDISDLHREWKTFLYRWHRRVGATTSSLLASFLCTMLISDDTTTESAAHINKVVMDEAAEVTVDVYDTEHHGADVRSSASRGIMSFSASSESLDEALTYTALCYVLRNVAEALFPERDPVAAVHLLVSILRDRIHRIHY